MCACVFCRTRMWYMMYTLSWAKIYEFSNHHHKMIVHTMKAKSNNFPSILQSSNMAATCGQVWLEKCNWNEYCWLPPLHGHRYAPYFSFLFHPDIHKKWRNHGCLSTTHIPFLLYLTDSTLVFAQTRLFFCECVVCLFPILLKTARSCNILLLENSQEVLRGVMIYS